MNPGKPISEAPRDGTIIIISVMNYCGVPETGHHSFQRVIPSSLSKNWCPVGEPNYHVGESCILGWWPDGSPEDEMEKRERTNWKYVPSNGTEGEIVYENWCANCKKDAAFREDQNKPGCDILSRTMAFGIGDPQYPEEWTYKDGGPKCTALDPIK